MPTPRTVSEPLRLRTPISTKQAQLCTLVEPYKGGHIGVTKGYNC